MARRRERILDAAREIIAQRGYEALTMRELAVAGRVTVPTIYNLIGNKEAVLIAAIDDQLSHFVAAIERERGEGAATGVLAVVESNVHELLRMPRYYRSLLMLLFTSDAAQQARQKVYHALRGQIARGVEQVRAAGDLQDWVEPRLLVDRLSAHLEATALQWASGTLGAEMLRATSLYEACIAMLGASRGASAGEFQRIAEQVQHALTTRGLPRRRSSEAAP